MSTFADYAFYRAHGGQLSANEYAAAADDAYADILSQTNGAALTAHEDMQDSVKLCECKLVDVIASYKEAAAVLPRGVSSVSNDGYSVSAGSVSPPKAEAKERLAVCRRYLQWPDNLMYRGI
jgi:hypothetical protein